MTFFRKRLIIPPVIEESTRTEPKLHFVIATCLQLRIACDLLHNNIKSIQRFHPEANITVCVDNSDESMVDESKNLFKETNITWVDNPFPKSGEFGTFYVASHIVEKDDTIIFSIHDSTCMRRAITAADLKFISDFKPLWNTPLCDGIFYADSPMPFVTEYVLPSARLKMSDEDYTKFEAIMLIGTNVTFGGMVAGSYKALNKVWYAGLDSLSNTADWTRRNRMRIERLVSLCANAAGFKTDSALCGSIWDHEGVQGYDFTNVTTYPLFSDEEVPSTRPPFYKLWVGR